MQEGRLRLRFLLPSLSRSPESPAKRKSEGRKRKRRTSRQHRSRRQRCRAGMLNRTNFKFLSESKRECSFGLRPLPGSRDAAATLANSQGASRHKQMAWLSMAEKPNTLLAAALLSIHGLRVKIFAQVHSSFRMSSCARLRQGAPSGYIESTDISGPPGKPIISG